MCVLLFVHESWCRLLSDNLSKPPLPSQSDCQSGHQTLKDPLVCQNSESVVLLRQLSSFGEKMVLIWLSESLFLDRLRSASSLGLELSLTVPCGLLGFRVSSLSHWVFLTSSFLVCTQQPIRKRSRRDSAEREEGKNCTEDTKERNFTKVRSKNHCGQDPERVPEHTSASASFLRWPWN